MADWPEGIIKDEIFVQLRSKDQKVRDRAVEHLHAKVIKKAIETPEGNDLEACYSLLCSEVGNLIESDKTHEVLGGLQGAQALIALFCSEKRDSELQTYLLPGANKVRMASDHWREALQAVYEHGDIEVRKMASETVAELVVVDDQPRKVMENLQFGVLLNNKSSNDHAVFLAYLLRLAQKELRLVQYYQGWFSKSLTMFLSDPDRGVRENAALCLRKVLEFLRSEGPRAYDDHLDELVKLARSVWHPDTSLTQLEHFYPNWEKESPALYHGALLMYHEVVVARRPADVNKIMLDVLQLKESPTDFIRHEVIALFTLFAKYNTRWFIEYHLHSTMMFYISQLSNRVDCAPIWQSIGQIVPYALNNMAQYVQILFQLLPDALKDESCRPAGFFCIAMLRQYVNSALIAVYLPAILDPILACPLSDSMISCLWLLVNLGFPSNESMLQVAPKVSRSLLDIVSQSLLGYPFTPAGTPGAVQKQDLHGAEMFRKRHAGHFATEVAELDITEIPGVERATTDDPVVQTFKALAHIPFQGEFLATDFVVLCLRLYIGSPSAEVRVRACETVLLLAEAYMAQAVEDEPISMASKKALGTIVGLVLPLAIADPEHDVRLQLLPCLDKECFWPYLGSRQNIKVLVFGFRDEDADVRLAALNVALSMETAVPTLQPLLRTLLLSLVSTLKHGECVGVDDFVEACGLLGLLVSRVAEFALPYMKIIVENLGRAARDKNTRVATAALTLVGNLADQFKGELDLYVEDFMDDCIESVVKQVAPYRRDAALQTMCLLCTATTKDIVHDKYPVILRSCARLLKAETRQETRSRAVRLIGLLGAVSPYSFHQADASIDRKLFGPESSRGIDASILDEMLTREGQPDIMEDYFYIKVVVLMLLKLLRAQPSQAKQIFRVFADSFRTAGPEIEELVPSLIDTVESVADLDPCDVCRCFIVIVRSLQLVVRPHISEMLAIVESSLEDGDPELYWLYTRLVAECSVALKQEFRAYVTRVFGYVLPKLRYAAASREPDACEHSVNLLALVGQYAQDYRSMIVPLVVRLTLNGRDDVRKTALVALRRLCRTMDLAEHSSEIVHSMLRVVSVPSVLRELALTTILTLMGRMSKDFAVFVPTVRHVLGSRNEQFEKLWARAQVSPIKVDYDPEFAERALLPQTQQPVRRTASTKDISFINTTKEKWAVWLDSINRLVIQKSPVEAVRSCGWLAQKIPELRHGLFHVAFASYWLAQEPKAQDMMAEEFLYTLRIDMGQPEVQQSMLSLVEFMARVHRPLPIHEEDLADIALKCHAYAKSLRYRELCFRESPTLDVVQRLMDLHDVLQQRDSSVGTYEAAKAYSSEDDMLTQGVKFCALDVDEIGRRFEEAGLEKLERWDEALQQYNVHEQEDPMDRGVILGKVHCYDALGRWQELCQFVDSKMERSATDLRMAMAPIAASAAWTLGEWADVASYTQYMSKQGSNQAFFEAVCAVHDGDGVRAAQQIAVARECLAKEFATLSAESYSRTYPTLVRIQMLSELEEVLRYQADDSSDKYRQFIRDGWKRRLLACQRDVAVWSRLLNVHMLGETPKQDSEMWIKFANLCRKNNRITYAEQTFNLLTDCVDSAKSPGKPRMLSTPEVVFAQIKFKWAVEQQEQTLVVMNGFARDLGTKAGIDMDKPINAPFVTEPGSDKDKYMKLISRCYVKVGQWTIKMHPDWTDSDRLSAVILGNFLMARQFYDRSAKAWHGWAMANYEMIPEAAKRSQSRDAVEFNMIAKYVAPAVEGFFRAMVLRHRSSMQDLLRIITLWMRFGGIDAVAEQVQVGLESLDVGCWLDVCTQLISGIHQDDPTVQKMLLSLLDSLGKEHPQAMVYPLTVAIQSESSHRVRAAQSVMDNMRLHSSQLVSDADLVSSELIRVSIMWQEEWPQRIEEALKEYWRYNVDGTLAIFERLHQKLVKGPETIRERTFVTKWGKILTLAHQYLQEHHSDQSLRIAFTEYERIRRVMMEQLDHVPNADLRYTSPKLLKVHNLELAVPGTYVPGKKFPRIGSFSPHLPIISSKQRPRKLVIVDTEGRRHAYALKGHEDIRQDSLIMQLFGLVNTLLSADPECSRRNLTILRYHAVPLSPSAGMLSWVPNADTFNDLVGWYRARIHVSKSFELQRIGLFFDMPMNMDSRMPLLNRIEALLYALEARPGEDIYETMWLRASSSETWVDNRLNYTRSLAVMSIVGYILGVGDRHPSNLMMDRSTGQVIHIDFGDCFDSAVLREKFPEKVPFRLTRMLCYAMGIHGVKGPYETACKNVLRLIRLNKDSLMAILEAFAYDPLINWGFDYDLDSILKAAGRKLPANDFLKLYNKRAITRSEYLKRQREYDDGVRKARAWFVLSQISKKMGGEDMKEGGMEIDDEVALLIERATSVENLAQHYPGWCPFW